MKANVLSLVDSMCIPVHARAEQGFRRYHRIKRDISPEK